MKTKLISLLLIGAAISAGAQDKALLDTLVKKGTLTQQEAAEIAKSSVSVVTACNKDTKSIKFFGGVQDWHSWNEISFKNSSNREVLSGFDLRYVKLGFKADVGNGWSATVVTDFGIEGSQRDYLDTVVISREVDFCSIKGTLDLGMRKVNFGLEQMACDFNQLAIERSVATWFFTRGHDTGNGVMDFGSRYLGAFWNGEVKELEGLYYGAAITSNVSSENGVSTSTYKAGARYFAYWANVGFKNKVDLEGDSVAYDAGLNFGFSNGGYYDGFADANNNTVYGLNPYASVKWRGATVAMEYFLQQVQNGRINAGTSTATPQGLNFTAAYKFDLGEWGGLEPVFRFSTVSSNGMGVVASDGMSWVPYNRVQEYYFGANWYVISSVKLSAGYTWGQYSGGYTAGQDIASSNGVRAQVQVLF